MPAEVFGLDTGGMDAAECVNQECPEFGIPKPLMCEVRPGENVICGGCGHICPTDFYQGLTYTIPAPPWEEPIERLEIQMANVTSLMERIAETLGVGEVKS